MKLLIARLVALIGFAAALAGCQSNLPVNPALSEDAIVIRDAKLTAFKPWRALGSLALVSETEGVFNASFAWDSDGTGYQIKLFGPLGVQSFQVTKNESGARLQSGQNEEVSGSSAEQLLLEALGVQLPLQEMQDWVVGLQGSAKNARRDKAGRLEKLIVGENGQKWRVIFARYTAVGDLDLPKAIEVSSDGIEINLSIKKWMQLDVHSNDRLVIPGVGS